MVSNWFMIRWCSSHALGCVFSTQICKPSSSCHSSAFRTLQFLLNVKKQY